MRMPRLMCEVTKKVNIRNEQDIESVGLNVEDVLDMTKWKKQIQSHSGHPS